MRIMSETGPGPRCCERPSTVVDAERARRLDCVHMLRCLTVADKGGWPAFACGSGCYERICSFQRALDHEALTHLRLAIEERLPR